MTLQTHETLPAPDASEMTPQEVVAEMRAKIEGTYGSKAAEKLGPIIGLAAEAHDGIKGADGQPLALHCADVATGLTKFTDRPTVEQVQLGLLHDSVTKGYTNFVREQDGAVDAKGFMAKAQAATV